MAKSHAASRALRVVLSAHLAARLAAHAAERGDDEADVIADAVLLHIEEADEAKAREDLARAGGLIPPADDAQHPAVRAFLS